MQYVIGLDLGTTRTKAVAISPGGDLIAQKSVGYPLEQEDKGTVQDPEKVWRAVIQCLGGIRQVAGEEALAIGASGAMHSLLPINESGNPLMRAVTWADTRSAPWAQKLRDDESNAGLYRSTGCPLRYPYYPARLRWLKEYRLAVFRRAHSFLNIKDWIVGKLTGEAVTDCALASTTGLLNVYTGDWHPPALKAAGVSAARLPPIKPPEQAFNLQETIASNLGFLTPPVLVAGSSDGALANLGAGALDPGDVVLTLGTSAAIRATLGEPYLDPGERIWCYFAASNLWIAGVAINNAGLALEWVQRTFFPEKECPQRFAPLMAEANEVSPGAEGLLFVPHLTGERSPYWRTEPHGIMIGLSLGHTRGHIVRAAMEGVAFSLAALWEVLQPGLPSARGSIHLTGGVTNAPLWMQILADVLGAPLKPVKVADASALGAAAVAGNQIWGGGISKYLPRTTQNEIVTPDKERYSFYKGLREKYQEVYKRFTSF